MPPRQRWSLNLTPMGATLGVALLPADAMDDENPEKVPASRRFTDLLGGKQCAHRREQ